MSSSDKICKHGASKSNDNDVCEMNDMLQQLSTADVLVCANCGKEGGSKEINNICNKCKMVKYCNAACKKKHRHKHKKQCDEYGRLAAERAAKLHDIELFKQPPPQHGDCPICFLRLPSLETGWRYMTCCGKVICSGCLYAPLYDNQGNKVDNEKCAFCRTPTPESNEETAKRMNKRVEAGDSMAIYDLGCCYRDGEDEYPQDYTKAIEHWHRAGELGHAAAYSSIGNAYHYGRGVEADKKKAVYYCELAAMGGDAIARYNLGFEETEAGNYDRALRHHTIAVGIGYNESLQTIQQLYSNGHVTKGDYTIALQLYQEYLGEIKSKHRDEAAAVREDYCYY